MRVTLDECLPRPFGRELAGHAVTTVPQAGLAGVVNGALLRRLVGTTDAFITVDKSLPHQQQLSGLPFGIVVLRVRSNRLEHVQPMAAAVLKALETLKPGDVVQVS